MYIVSRIAYDYLIIIVSTLQIEFHLYIATDYLETLVSIESGYLELMLDLVRLKPNKLSI